MAPDGTLCETCYRAFCVVEPSVRLSDWVAEAKTRVASRSSNRRVEALGHGDIEVWSGDPPHTHQFSPTSKVLGLMDALRAAHDCIAFEGSLDQENNTRIANRALDKIAAALASVEHLQEALRRQQQWDAEQAAKVKR
jgi:hypothetical protein